jgi:hypothetical protein
MRDYRDAKSAAWLPKGGSAVKQFHISEVGAYGWDGQYFVIASRPKSYAELLTRYKLHGENGRVVGHVSLKGCAPNYEPSFSIEGSELAFSCGQIEYASLNYYKYPTGGNPVKALYGVGGRAAISIGSSHSGAP